LKWVLLGWINFIKKNKDKNKNKNKNQVNRETSN
jgi:hypothetical protein